MIDAFASRTASPEENAAFQQADGFTNQRTGKSDTAGSAVGDSNLPARATPHIYHPSRSLSCLT